MGSIFVPIATAMKAFSNCKMIFQLLYWAYQNFFGRTPQ